MPPARCPLPWVTSGPHPHKHHLSAPLLPRCCSFVQGAAAAQGGISVIQPNVGRLHDWYNRHPGYIRDPKGPLEESYYGKQSDINPGVLLVQRLYNYVKCHHPKTLIMASGIRTKQGEVARSSTPLDGGVSRVPAGWVPACGM